MKNPSKSTKKSATSGIGLEIRHLSGAAVRSDLAVPQVTEAVTVAVSVAWLPSEMKHATTSENGQTKSWLKLHHSVKTEKLNFIMSCMYCLIMMS